MTDSWQAARWFLFWLIILLLVIFTASRLSARDSGQWEGTNPAIRQWYQSLMQPDNPTVPCCGLADSYWADEIRIRDGETYAVITDDRPDEPLGRPHIPKGTEFLIPPHKLKWDRGNPTGHNILFVGAAGSVYCFVQTSGV